MDIVQSSNRIVNSFPPLNNITPFTRVDGWSFLEVLEGLRNYIVNIFRPEIDENFELIEKQMNEWFIAYQKDHADLLEQILSAKNEWQDFFDQFIIDVINQLAGLNDKSVAQLILDTSSETRKALEEWYMIYGGDALNRVGKPLGTTNLNTLFDPGFYHQNVISNVNSLNNYPFTSSSCRVEIRRFQTASTGVVQIATNNITGQMAWRRSTNTGTQWTDWEFYSTSADTEAAIREYTSTRFYPLDIIDSNFEVATGSALLVECAGNVVTLVGALSLKTDGYIDRGNPERLVAKFPPDSKPNLVYPRYFTHQNEVNGETYIVRISGSGLYIYGYGGESKAGAYLPISSNWVTRSRPTTMFGKLFGMFFEGEDWQTRKIVGTFPKLSSIAIHGGEVEPGSSECAMDLSARLSASFYEHDAMKTYVWGDKHVFNVMHPDSNGYDDPDALDVVRASERCVSFHGAANNVNGVTGAVSWVGGRDVELRTAITQKLRAAGFVAYDNVETFPTLAGTNATNICNKTKTLAGVQIEASVDQRKQFFPNNDYSRENRLTGMRTNNFNNYMQAIEEAVKQVMNLNVIG